MDIAVITDVYLPRISGVAHIIDGTYAELKKAGKVDDVHVICSHFDPELPRHETINSLHVHRFKSPTILSGRIMVPSLDAVRMIIDVCKNPNITQVHLHTRFSTINPVAVCIAKMMGKKIVLVEHLAGFIVGESRALVAFSRIWDETLSRLMYRMSDAIVAVSQSAADFITGRLSAQPKKVTVIENACRLQPLKQAVPRSFHSPVRLLYAGRLVGTKQPMLVLQALKTFHEKYPDYPFQATLGGGGVLEDEMVEYIAKNQMESCVEFVGKIPAQQMQQYFKNSDIFVYPTLLEGLPGGVVEALFLNCMVITTNVGGNRDVITDPAFQIDVQGDQVAQLVDRLHWAISSPAESLVGVRALKKRATQRFSWKTVVDAYEQHIL